MVSQPRHEIVDRASPLDIGRRSESRLGGLEVRTTDTVEAGQTLVYWREAVLRRVEALGPGAPQRRFHARLVHVAGPDADFVEHVSDAVTARRDLQRLRRDGCDDISISLLASQRPAGLIHRGEHRLRGGDICIMDYAQPMEILRPRHHDVSLICSRQRLSALLGADLPALAGRRLPRRGITALLRSHMRLMSQEIERLSPVERTLALSAAVEMALAALQAELGFRRDEERFPAGLYQAAQLAIRRDCHDPELNPLGVAAAVGCSRATLYRLFAARGDSVAAAIWTARIERAHAMLTSPEHRNLRAGEIARRSGFVDQPTFNRMFKRRYDMTPLDAARMAVADPAGDRRP